MSVRSGEGCNLKLHNRKLDYLSVLLDWDAWHFSTPSRRMFCFRVMQRWVTRMTLHLDLLVWRQQHSACRCSTLPWFGVYTFQVNVLHAGLYYYLHYAKKCSGKCFHSVHRHISHLPNSLLYSKLCVTNVGKVRYENEISLVSSAYNCEQLASFNFEVCHPRCVFRYNGLGYVIVKRTQLFWLYYK
jgi:hypothetical protein